MSLRGNLIIVSGPSGSGKTSVSGSVLAALPALRFSVSFTTRAPRGSEQDGREYHFVSKADFEKLIRAGEFLEWAQVYGNYYGTSARFVDGGISEGCDVLLDVDVQGAEAIRERRPDSISIFILPPSYQTLQQRLELRALDKRYVMEQRLRIARQEVRHYRNYDYLIVNDLLANAVEELKSIIIAARCRKERRAELAQSVLSKFGGMDD